MSRQKSDPVQDNFELTFDQHGNRYATLTLTFGLKLPRTPQSAKDYLTLHHKAEWIHLRTLTQAWARSLRSLAHAEKESSK